jgi:very-short-patch-repair endonuclease
MNEQQKRSGQRGAGPGPSLRKAQTSSREDYVATMPAAQFEAWCRNRLTAAAHDRELERVTRAEIEGERRLRAEQRERERLLALGQGSPEYELCESPLECRLLDAFWHTGAFQPVVASAGTLVGWSNVNGALLTQLSVRAGPSSYRLDFAVIVASHNFFLAVEVDGRDFHQRTAEQVLRDRRRDRHLAARGWVPLRFAGHEVYRDADACAREVVDAVSWRLRWARRIGGRR